MNKMDNETKNKTIKMTVYMFTNDLPAKKQAWNDGVVHMKANKLHGIRATENKPLASSQFKGIENVGDAIKEVLMANNVTLFDDDKKAKRQYIVKYDDIVNYNKNNALLKSDVKKILDEHYNATPNHKPIDGNYLSLLKKFGC